MKQTSKAFFISAMPSFGIVKTFAAAAAGAAVVDFLVALLCGFSAGSISTFGIVNGLTCSAGNQGIIRPVARATQIARHISG